MPTFDDKLDHIQASAEAMLKSAQRAEHQMLTDILVLLGRLEVSNGHVVTSTSNLNLLNSLQEILERSLLSSGYASGVGQYSKSMDVQAQMNIDYYASAFNYSPSPQLVAIKDVNKRQAIDMMLGGAVDREFYTPVISAITQGVTTGSGFHELKSTIQTLVVGSAEQPGRLSRYVGQIAYDTMAVTDRTYNQQIASELGIEFYAFTGGIINDTRQWCADRNGKVYHENEIAAWATGDWQGKNRQTTSSSIFVLLGGYNCKHSLIPVPLSAVPNDVLSRNLANGNLTLTDAQRRILGVN